MYEPVVRNRIGMALAGTVYTSPAWSMNVVYARLNPAGIFSTFFLGSMLGFFRISASILYRYCGLMKFVAKQKCKLREVRVRRKCNCSCDVPNWIQKGNWVKTEQLILSIGTILLAARVFGWLFQHMGQPRVVGKRQQALSSALLFLDASFRMLLALFSPHRPCRRLRF